MPRIIHLVLLLSLGHGAVAQRLLPVGEGVHGVGVYDAVEYNGKMILGGWFDAFNGQARNSVIGWDGDSGYDLMPGAFSLPQTRVECLEIYQGDLIAGGKSYGAADTVMRWNSIQWQPLGTPFNGRILDLAVHNGDLIACGRFSQNNGVPMGYVARWDGNGWQPMASGFDTTVHALAIYVGELYAAGGFTAELAGGNPVLGFARWTGSTWVQVHTGLIGTAMDLLSSADGLFVVGSITASGTGQVLGGGALYDGAAFIDVALPSPCDELVGETPFGVMFSGDAGTFIRNGTIYDRYPWKHVSSFLDYQSVNYLGGDFQHISYRTVNNVGRLLPGKEQAALEVAGVRAKLEPNGTFFMMDEAAGGGYEVPAGSGVTSIGWMGLVSTAVANGELYATQWSYPGQPSCSWEGGPWATDTTPTYLDRYFQIWPMDEGRVWDHVAQWNDPGYTVPYAIADWPGNGDPGNGEPDRLVAFQDGDGDDLYEPEDGEVPNLNGTSSMLTTLSDHQPTEWEDPVRLDVITQTYGYASMPGDTLYQVTLMSNRIVNRSANTYDTLHFGVQVGFDLGCEYDNYVGCDTSLAMAYVYNGDGNDEPCNGGPGYGLSPPAQGILGLNAPLFAFTKFDYSDHPYGYPSQPYMLHNYLRGRKRNGLFHVQCPFTDSTRYLYAGDPWVPGEANETACGNNPSARNVIASFGPYFSVSPGDTICLDLALVFAAGNGDNLLAVQQLEQRATAVRAWYDQRMNGCAQPVTLSVPTASGASSLEFTLYPVPTGDRLHLRSSGGMRVASAEVLTLDGRSLGRSNMLGTEGISVGHLAPGIYHLAAYTMEGDRLVRSFVKE